MCLRRTVDVVSDRGSRVRVGGGNGSGEHIGGLGDFLGLAGTNGEII